LLEFPRVGKRDYEAELVDIKTLVYGIIETQGPPKSFSLSVESELPVFNTESPFRADLSEPHRKCCEASRFEDPDE
jgi:hypothetical protein